MAITSESARSAEVRYTRARSRGGDFTVAATVALTALAFAIAAYRLGAKSLWLDEAVSVDHARLGLHGLWKVISKTDPNMGLYYVLLHFWVRVFGYGEVAVRSMSVFLAGWAVPVIVVLGRRLFGRVTGLVAGLLLALSPFFLEYEQTARSYGLVVLLVLLSTYFFVRALENPTRASLVGYVIASALAIYSQYFAAYVLLVHLGALLVMKRRGAFTRGWTIAGVAIAVLCAPEVVFAFRKGTGGISWIRDPTIHELLHLPVAFAGGAAIAGVLIVLACWGFARTVAGRPRWQVGLVAAWLLGPVLLDFAISKAGHPMFVTYYLIVVLPAFLLLAAQGVARLPGRELSACALVLLVVLLAVGIHDWYDSPSIEEFRGAARYVFAHERAGDAAVYYPAGTASYAVAYYADLAHVNGPTQLRYRLGRPLSAEPSRLWLVIRNESADASLRHRVESSLSGSYEEVGGRPGFGNVTVILYRRKAR